jgi:hypothetical protein
MRANVNPLAMARDFDEPRGRPSLWNAAEVTKLTLSPHRTIGRRWLRDEFALPPVRQYGARHELLFQKR